LRSAFLNFFAKRGKYPRWKSKGRSRESFRIPQRISIKGRRLYIPKVGHLRLSEAVNLTGFNHKSTTFTLDSSGHWHACLIVEFELPKVALPKLRDNHKTVGLDAGLKELLVLSDGTKVTNPRYYQNQQKKLSKAQKNLSRKQKNSKNRIKAQQRVNKIHARIRNQRHDYLHKITSELVTKYETIIIEDLSLKGMTKTKLSKSVNDAALGKIRRQLEYKTRWNHKRLIVIDRWFASSKICSNCGHKNQALSLADRAWTCQHCYAEHDRDLNAARNIRQEGLRQAGLVSSVAVGKTETLNACGEHIRRSAACSLNDYQGSADADLASHSAQAASAMLVETRTPSAFKRGSFSCRFMLLAILANTPKHLTGPYTLKRWILISSWSEK